MKNPFLFDPLNSSIAKEMFRQQELERSVFGGSLSSQRMFDDMQKIELYKSQLGRFDALKPYLDRISHLEMHSSTLTDLYSHSESLSAFDSILKKCHLFNDDGPRASVLRAFYDLPLAGLESKPSIPFENLHIDLDLLKLYPSPSLADLLPKQPDLLSVIGSFRPIWTEPTINVELIEGTAGLIALRNAINRSPYSAKNVSAIEALLGHWDNSKVNDQFINDWEVRRKAYLDSGFDSRLSAFPPRLFTNALLKSKLLRPDLYSPVFPLPVKAKAGGEKEIDPQSEAEEEIKKLLRKAYDLICHLEMVLREYLEEVMTAQFGEKWVKQRVPGAIYKAWEEKRAAALDKGEPEMPLLHYADFTDYEVIIVRGDNWKDVFKLIFKDQKGIQVSFQRMYPIRICTMHFRPISQDDFVFLVAEIRRILKAIGRKNYRIDLDLRLE